MSWEGKKTKADFNRYSSLKTRYLDHDHFQKDSPLTEQSASTKVCLVYDSIRTGIEALTALHGYRVYTHVGLVEFIKQTLKNDALASRFDTYRIIRNRIQYDGKNISVQKAAKLIEDMEDFLYHLGHLLQ